MVFGLNRQSEFDDDGFKEAHIKPQAKEADAEQGDVKGDSIPNEEGFTYVPPDIVKAKENFNMSLPRRVRDALQPTGHRINVPGEMRSGDGEPAELYKPFSSTQAEFAEFGVGITLYFYSLKLLNGIFLVAAFVSLIAIRANTKFNCEDVRNTLVGSVYCATREDLTWQHQGVSDLFTTLFVLVGFFAAFRLLDKKKEEVDLNSLTTRDYSVVITNPDREISNPDEYRDHFAQFGDVALVTIVLNNGNFVQHVTKKKVLEQELEREKTVRSIAKAGGILYKEDADLGWFTRLYTTSVTGIEKQLEDVKRAIASDTNKDYSPWRVYITFNKEREQQECLVRTDLTTREIAHAQKNGDGVLPIDKRESFFKGTVLDVRPAQEPDDILYENSNSTYFTRTVSYMKSYGICMTFIVICYYIMKSLNQASTQVVAAFISITNAVIPMLVKYITAEYEIHLDRSSAQLSSMLKLTVARCFNSGVLIFMSVDFNDRFSEEALSQIQSILIADAVSTPFLRMLDLSGLYSRHVASKSAVTQSQLDMLFKAQSWSLAERYTDTLKTVFVGLMYAVPLPSGMFITSFAMMVSYWVDKYSLYRVWERPPSLDSSLADLSKYFFYIMLWLHVLFARLWFANWPFADVNDSVSCGMFFCETVTLSGEKQSTLNSHQVGLVTLYEVFNLVLFIMMVIFTYKLFFQRFVAQHIYRVGHVINTTNDTAFRSLSTVSGYVPLVRNEMMTKPILMCEVSELPEKYAPVFSAEDDFTDAPRDPTVFSVVNETEFPDVPTKDLTNIFSHVSFYSEEMTAAALYQKQHGGAQKPQVRAPAVASMQTIDENGVPLPVGWAMKMTGGGKKYYINHITRTTQWKSPNDE
jgi:hypothetical protein